MQIYPMEESPNKWVSNTMKITAVEVDDEHDCVREAVAYDLPAYNNRKLADKLVPTFFVKVNGICGQRYYTVNFFRNPFKKRTKLIDDALAGAMYQYSIASNEKTTQAYNQVNKRNRKKQEMQAAFTYYLIIIMFFADVYMNLVSDFSPTVILFIWYFLTALFALGLMIDAIIHFNKRKNYQLTFFTIAPMLFGFSIIPSMSMICYLVIVALAIWSIVVQIMEVETPPELKPLTGKEQSSND